MKNTPNPPFDDSVEQMTSRSDILKQKISQIRELKLLSKGQFAKAEEVLSDEDWVLLSYSPEGVKLSICMDAIEQDVFIAFVEDEVDYNRKGKSVDWDVVGYVGLKLCLDHESWMTNNTAGKTYTREGMIRRVLEERLDKANGANYKVRLGSNLYGPHSLTNEKGQSFQVTLWDWAEQIGYIDNIDWRTNKLATTKHIMYLYDYLEDHPRKVKKLISKFPFIDITLDPLQDYKITWKYIGKIKKSASEILEKYFGGKTHLESKDYLTFLPFLSEAQQHKDFLVRPEVLETIDIYFNKLTTRSVFDSSKLDYSRIKAELYGYQKEGVEFVVQRTGAIIADEMGLGKTVQAIASSIFKRQLYDFKKVLIICPASIKYQWKSEIEKFTDETALVVEGFPHERARAYLNNDSYFNIINYERVLRDIDAINRTNYDFVILDEAQKIKNFNTKTAQAIKKVKKKHGLVITGTPIENKLVDLYSIVQFVNPYMLTPLWEFSYQHCIFDPNSKHRILGYYNLSDLKSRLNDLIIRREKRTVLDQLPTVNQKNVYVRLHPDQASIHAGAATGVAKILSKRFKTTFDWQRLMMLLNTMRMACDCTYLVDKQTRHSSKLEELRHILSERLDLKNNKRKVIIFSEWINMLHLIGELLDEEGYGYTMLTGKVPVKKRGKLITEFETNDDCRVFLSTESGGSGLNLQMADIVINFELPWNPAKKNQRIGRIDRLGQRSDKLTVFNLVSVDSIEQKIALGLLLKQSLFDGVLNQDMDIDSVDFSEKGRSQFISQLEDIFLNKEEDLENDSEAQVYSEDQGQNIQDELELESAGDAWSDNENVQNGDNGEKLVQMESVLNKGMEFLSGMYKMVSGEELLADGEQCIKVDQETGEVTMKFKMKI